MAPIVGLAGVAPEKSPCRGGFGRAGALHGWWHPCEIHRGIRGPAGLRCR